MKYLGIDTSNYATSVAIYNSVADMILASVKLPLPVAEGQLGLRQSDAVFAHVKQLPEAFALLKEQTDLSGLAAIGVSARPRCTDSSYMPCFLAGLAAAAPLGACLGVPVREFSHQQGHVMAALFGTGTHKTSSGDFYAFHVSGGTTDLLRCARKNGSLSVATIATSQDLFAGQAVDRVGAALGFSFPAGPALSELAAKSDTHDHAKPVLREGNCCLSGLQNQCEALIAAGKQSAYIARYCLNSISATILEMANLHCKNGDLIFAGGVLSSDIVRATIKNRLPDAQFCTPASLSADNAVGTAILAALASEGA